MLSHNWGLVFVGCATGFCAMAFSRKGAWNLWPIHEKCFLPRLPEHPASYPSVFLAESPSPPCHAKLGFLKAQPAVLALLLQTSRPGTVLQCGFHLHFSKDVASLHMLVGYLHMFFYEMHIHVFCLFFFFILGCCSLLFWMWVLYQLSIFLFLILLCSLFFSPLMVFFDEEKFLFECSPICQSFLFWLVFVSSDKALPTPRTWRHSCMFSSKGFFHFMVYT